MPTSLTTHPRSAHSVTKDSITWVVTPDTLVGCRQTAVTQPGSGQFVGGRVGPSTYTAHPQTILTVISPPKGDAQFLPFIPTNQSASTSSWGARIPVLLQGLLVGAPLPHPECGGDAANKYADTIALNAGAPRG